MNTKIAERAVISIRLDADAALAGGQTFAFWRVADVDTAADAAGVAAYAGVADGRAAVVRQKDDGESVIICRPSDIPFFLRYFDADRDLPVELASVAARDARLAACLAAYPGLRLLRQPAWETLCMFILSANNNIPRIGKTYRAIARALGDPVAWASVSTREAPFKRPVETASAHAASVELPAAASFELSAFPSPRVLAEAGEAPLRAAGAGYRAPYLVKTAKMVAEGFSLDFDAMEYEKAHKHLTECAGVGDKVADCVLLASSRHASAFPVDVWVERALKRRYGFAGSRREIKRQARERFGELAGAAQLFLFHAERQGL